MIVCTCGRSLMHAVVNMDKAAREGRDATLLSKLVDQAEADVENTTVVNIGAADGTEGAG